LGAGDGEITHTGRWAIVEGDGVNIRMVTKTAFALVIAAAALQAQAAPTVAPWGHVIIFSAGWNEADAKVMLDSAFYNPSACSFTDGYMVDHTLGGAALFASTLLTAYSTHQRVQLTVDGCYVSRPRIIGIDMMP
jgi:hypothetical protein